MLLLCARALPQEPAPGGMLRSYLQGIALQQLASRKERVSEILTPEQFEKRKAEVRHLLLTLMGGLPEKRADLKVQKMAQSIGEITVSSKSSIRVCRTSMSRLICTCRSRESHRIRRSFSLQATAWPPRREPPIRPVAWGW